MKNLSMATITILLLSFNAQMQAMNIVARYKHEAQDAERYIKHLTWNLNYKSTIASQASEHNQDLINFTNALRKARDLLNTLISVKQEFDLKIEESECQFCDFQNKEENQQEDEEGNPLLIVVSQNTKETFNALLQAKYEANQAWMSLIDLPTPPTPSDE
jgi:hypothetical protein